LVEKRYDETLSLDGRGLLFVPSAFVWPGLLVIAKRPWQPTLLYPARGIGTLWDPERPAARAALGALLGARRADVLSALDAPRSTTEVARALDVSAASASQHLTVLRDAGLVNAHRVGRSVLYARSPAGESLADERPTD
jgi:DNA-binding transcriptional ArsR family regulator